MTTARAWDLQLVGACWEDLSRTQGATGRCYQREGASRELGIAHLTSLLRVPSSGTRDRTMSVGGADVRASTPVGHMCKQRVEWWQMVIY